jgi:hypothetical protein
MERYHLNKGDFYVCSGNCTVCGAPGAEAPDLIEHDGVDGHCYFKKAPETEEEVDQAVLAMLVSCTNALRYGGIDEQIIKRLYENGMADLCDNKPAQKYYIADRNRVTFTFLGSLQELSHALADYLVGIGKDASVREEEMGQTDQFRVVHRWQPHVRGYIYEGRLEGDNDFSLVARSENGHRIGSNIMLYEFLKKDRRISGVKWWAQHPLDNGYYDKPF